MKPIEAAGHEKHDDQQQHAGDDELEVGKGFGGEQEAAHLFVEERAERGRQ